MIDWFKGISIGIWFINNFTKLKTWWKKVRFQWPLTTTPKPKISKPKKAEYIHIVQNAYNVTRKEKAFRVDETYDVKLYPDQIDSFLSNCLFDSPYNVNTFYLHYHNCNSIYIIHESHAGFSFTTRDWKTFTEYMKPLGVIYEDDISPEVESKEKKTNKSSKNN